MLDLLAGEGTLEDIWRLVRKKESFFFVDYLMRFVQRLLGEDVEIVKRLAEPYLPAVVKLLKNGDPLQRARAARILSMLGLKRYSVVVEEALDDSSPLVAMIAARALARQGHPQYVAAILDRLHRFANWSQSYLAAMLVNVGPKAAAILRETLIDPVKDERVRTVAADALRELNDLDAGDLATSVLRTESGRDLVAASLRLIGEVGRPEHLKDVRPLCKSDDFVVRAQAFKVLGAIGGVADLAILRQGMDDESPWTAIQAAWGLKEAGGEHILHELAASSHPRSELAQQVLAESNAE